VVRREVDTVRVDNPVPLLGRLMLVGLRETVG